MKLKILGIKPAVSKADKIYYKVSTNRGEMTAFDEDIVKELTPGKDVNLNVVQSEKDGRTYQNIRGFAMDDDEDVKVFAGTKEDFDLRVVKPQEFGRKTVKGSAYEKDPVGLAVEICIPLIEAKVASPMDKSIELVKQAQEAFS